MSANIRAELARLMRATLADQAEFHSWAYHAVRPMPVPATWHPVQFVRGDCSKGVQYLCRWAKAPDPMGSDYGPYGNSQTLWLKLRHLYGPGEMKVGDVVTFGRDGSEHAAMVLEPGSDPLLWSFGHQGAPNTYRLSQDRRPKQYLSLGLPDVVNTPGDNLRARTGWFAWVAWRLGEGDWSRYGKANANVRPNVPRVIPAGWWRRYLIFLRNRKRGNESTTP